VSDRWVDPQTRPRELLCFQMRRDGWRGVAVPPVGSCACSHRVHGSECRSPLPLPVATYGWHQKARSAGPVASRALEFGPMKTAPFSVTTS
jgi:hypothetical protein